MRALLDTSIVYDLLCRRPFDEEGLMQLMIMQEFGDVELWVSAKSYTDLFYLIRQELDSAEAHDLLEGTFEWALACSIEEDDIKRALQARWHDFEDSLVNVCAEKVKADYLITRNMKGFKNAALPHGCASDFMDFVYKRTGVRYALADWESGDGVQNAAALEAASIMA